MLIYDGNWMVIPKHWQIHFLRMASEKDKIQNDYTDDINLISPTVYIYRQV